MRRILLFVFAAFFFAACESSTDPGDSFNSPRWTMPVEGDAYRFFIVTGDSSYANDVFISGARAEETDDFTIMASNEEYAGHDSTFRYGWSQTFAEYNVFFEENGDWVVGNSAIPSELETYPTGAKGKRTIPRKEAQSGAQTTVTTGYYENHGWEKVTNATGIYDAIKVTKHLETVITRTSDGEVLRTQTIDHIQWFAPSLGFIVKSVRYTSTDQDDILYKQTRTQEMTEIL